MKTAILLIVAIAALGAVGVTTAIMSAAAPAQADSCQSVNGKDSCHGCAKRSEGWENSDHKCLHS
jgi:uncharacterized membrane protein